MDNRKLVLLHVYSKVVVTNPLIYSPLQERKFVGGSSQISECMARELGDRVKLQSPVYSIDQMGDMVVVETLDKQTYKVSIKS